MSTVRRAMAFSFLESYLGIALNLVSFVLLARLLTPKQVGLFSVALAIISVTQVIRDFGLVNFLIQKKELTSDYIASAWGLALILGTSLFLLIQLCAPLIGDFYHEESLTTIARIVALNFLILPFNSVCLALLRRELNFKTVMRINLSGAVLSTIATLLMAWQGAGAYALAFGAVLNNAIIAAGIWHVGAAARLLRPALTKWREIMKFGGPLTVANVITSITMDINDLAVGKIMGFSAVAIASRAQGLMNLFHRDFMGAVRNVAYPAFSKAVRNGDALEEKYVASVTNVTAIAWTFYGFAALFPLEVLRLMFGPQWDQSAPLVPFFCLAGAASAMINLTPTVLLAAGHSKLVATAELVIQPVKAIALCLVVFYYRNLQYFAIGFMVMAVVSVPYWYALKQRCLPTDFGALLRNVGMNLMLAVLSLAPALALTVWLRPAGQALGHAAFFACAGATCVAWPLLLWAFRHPLYREFLAIVQARRAPAGA
ncbi:lipopolysaccharide biosynthesis protein [Massilia scottii]|uniref:lipopolysaccharide biosynthesis protein n=1 Tax=Massilia scottii TaxID=3057166 RepID=UPI0027969ABA|nr:lipopolysaccharide biosynthesis protein [Massilia sp. CCM 9029]MDQ1830150.1 lipopolysaccharide biosynthesis protein [Massilia sp. CCM 9029]